jgi:prevent-host-death family protein
MLAAARRWLYPDAMTATLSNSQADLPRLVELASQGEDVVITVEGRPKARLTRAELVVRPRELSREETEQWMAELAELRARYSTGKPGLTVEQILEEDRADRV